jgi:hypothetical protein
LYLAHLTFEPAPLRGFVQRGLIQQENTMLLTTLRPTIVRTLVLFAALGIAFGMGSSVRADTVVVPNAQTSAEGNSNNRFPFGISPLGPPTQRYQQVYAASQFSPASGPLLITQILFRPDAISGAAFTATLPDIQINLSTTTPGPDGLSATFASNVGANDTIVRSRGALTLSSANRQRWCCSASDWLASPARFAADAKLTRASKRNFNFLPQAKPPAEQSTARGWFSFL